MNILNYFPPTNSARKRKLEDDDGNSEPPKEKRIRSIPTNEQQKSDETSVSNNAGEQREKKLEAVTDNNSNKPESIGKETNGESSKEKRSENNKIVDKEKCTDEVKTKLSAATTVITYSNCELLLDKSWNGVLEKEFDKPYYKQLKNNLAKAEQSGVQIFPPTKQVFRCFELCPFDNLKAVIIGQDPYHDNGQAEGLCFSVTRGIRLPSSLNNIYAEAKSDVAFQPPGHGSLVHWAMQGVLLLNTALTVQAHQANSHSRFGWHEFTDAVIKAISKHHNGVVFILWGKEAQKKIAFIDQSKHKIVQSPHPSGLSASRGFFGSKPFSKTNALLQKMNRPIIDWQIPK